MAALVIIFISVSCADKILKMLRIIRPYRLSFLGINILKIFNYVYVSVNFTLEKRKMTEGGESSPVFYVKEIGILRPEGKKLRLFL